jgi:Ca2+/Na+ antiporter
MDIYNLFDENEDFFLQKFSTMLIFIFIYYSISYFFILQEPIKKPHISFIFILILLHIIHIIIIKFLHNEEYYVYAWLAIIIPILLYLIYSKYNDYIKQKEKKKYDAMMEQARREVNGNHPDLPPQEFRNSMPQQPPRAPHHPTSIVDEMLMGDNRNMQNMQQDIAIKYDQNDMSGYNERQPEYPQQRQDLRTNMQDDMMGGFDPYASGFSPLF